MPWPDYRTVGPNIAWYFEKGVTGIYEESSYMAPGGDFAPLKSYVIARMMRDPKDDPDAILSEFVFAYYGAEAGPYVLRVVDTLTTAVRTCPGGHENPLCRIVVWTHISRLHHAMDPGKPICISHSRVAIISLFCSHDERHVLQVMMANILNPG